MPPLPGPNAPRKAATPPKPAKRPKGAEGIDVGDAVYVRHPKRGAISVSVSGVGRDGFTARCDEGKRHQIPFDAFLGHKARMLHRYELVEQGADGALVKDATGRQRFVAGLEMPEPEPPKADPAASATDDPIMCGMDRLKKAEAPAMSLMPFPEGKRLLLLKARPASRPAGKKPTPKEGKEPPPQPAGGEFSTKSEEKTDTGSAPMKHGDRVRFRHNDVEGAGRITASGGDGVTVEDDAGTAHQVRHEHLIGPDAEGQDGEGQGEAAAGGQPVSKELDNRVEKVAQAIRALFVFFKPGAKSDAGRTDRPGQAGRNGLPAGE